MKELGTRRQAMAIPIIDSLVDVIFVNLMVMYFLLESAVLCLGPPAKKMCLEGVWGAQSVVYYVY